MKFIIEQKKLLKALQKVSVLLLKNHSFAILENVLIQLNSEQLTITSTNLDTEITVYILIASQSVNISTTVSGRKLLNICKSLPIDSMIEIEIHEKKMTICSKNSNFELLTMPCDHFPSTPSFNHEVELILPQIFIKNMLQNTYFSMAINDVRYYLNGILLEINSHEIKMVATDGHRMAVCAINFKTVYNFFSVIISRKGILELIKLMEKKDCNIHLFVNKNNIKIKIKNIVFFSKLIDEKYPDYSNILLKNPDIKIKICVMMLKNALIRVSILADKKFQSVQFYFFNNQLELKSNNEEEEYARETLNIQYKKNEMKFSVNVNYVIDILNNIKDENIIISFNVPITSLQIQEEQQKNNYFVIMPLLL
ncbi:DNA polymerase III subunit beta [Buchnera aphidicola (Thelaxes californica)]|uniref:Beta sliding clamp n=1 Tax=Buchnera aphidicola (Thelaxes californica) TaxID=1315998 RepID=A0A4D6YAY6_9GAMM|nr:DNA polymerase III subunit beta [Buchnera aphidicola]QCI26569.1 DNA polymerase III subunit beta [Buchnera aphidicola (Thelaxes californica)]